VDTVVEEAIDALDDTMLVCGRKLGGVEIVCISQCQLERLGHWNVGCKQRHCGTGTIVASLELLCVNGVKRELWEINR
jgi:hypothetical protein